jgi:NADPH-dependent curcumin reductase CurA
MAVAKTVMLARLIPEGIPSQEDFAIAEGPAPVCEADGDIVLQVMAMSADPYLRSGCKSGDVPRPMSGFVAGKVIESTHADWPVGTLLGAHLPFTTVQRVSKEVIAASPIWNLSPFITEEQISYGVGVLGMPGSTAYGGLIDVLRPKQGETLFVSAAAGAVGQLVGQIGKNEYNLTVVGSCGGPAKNALIKEKFGFDHAIDYKTVADKDALVEKLKEATGGEGIDMYFGARQQAGCMWLPLLPPPCMLTNARSARTCAENVGGMHFEAAMETLRPHGRVAVCGAISEYNYKGSGLAGTAPPNNIKIANMIYSFQRIEGFVCMPWLKGERGHFLADMSRWLKESKIQTEETFFTGIEAWPAAFAALFTGANIGKVVVKTEFFPSGDASCTAAEVEGDE